MCDYRLLIGQYYLASKVVDAGADSVTIKLPTYLVYCYVLMTAIVPCLSVPVHVVTIQGVSNRKRMLLTVL